MGILFVLCTFKKGVTYTFNATPKKIEGTPRAYVRLLYKNNTIEISNQDIGSSGKKTFTPTEDITDMQLWFYGSFNNVSQNGIFEVSNVMISLDNNLSYRPCALNKKEISLNEPLRSVGNTKDKIVKIGGKWYIERNCAEVIFDGSDDENWGTWPFDGFPNGYLYRANGIKIKGKGIAGDCSAIADKTYKNIIYMSNSSLYDMTIHTSTQAETIVICDPRDINTFKQKLVNNPITVTYLRKEPIYEPLEIEPTLNTYNDVTHISNNSTIPCNMVVKNSGYNAIIKPSTLYTVALDTNKSGTVGINLGGAKVTTTNNVATVTTPATLTDDSLRLYGKGINASKVRLLEGDKTNWIPSHFEGMKSSFEDKVQADGTFKMEILSNNKNLVDSSKICRWSGNPTSLSHLEYPDYIPVKPNTYYRMNMDLRCVTHYDNNKKHITDTYNESFKTHNSCRYIKIRAFGREGVNIYPSDYKDFQLEEGTKVTEVVLNKSNKIQFSSIEPLKRVDDTKDKFIFKNNVLMIERNVGKVSIPSNFSVSVHRGSNEYYNSHSCGCYINTNIGNLIKTTGSDIEVICERFGYKYSIWGNGNYSEGICNIGGEGDGRIAMRIHNSLTGIVDSDDAGKCATKITNYLKANPFEVYFKLKEPTYEEVPFELQKIILEGYENGTLFIDTNIPPTSTVTYAGETPIVKSVRLNKTEVSNNTTDINDNIVPYLMDMDYRVVCLQLEGGIENVSMARLFGGTFEMLQRDILSNRYSKEEYKYRLDAYLSANKITEKEYEKLGDMLND